MNVKIESEEAMKEPKMDSYTSPKYIPSIMQYQRTQKAAGDIYRWLNVWKASIRP
jgi:hypothetical protein